jgi:hypothetical protein
MRPVLESVSLCKRLARGARFGLAFRYTRRYSDGRRRETTTASLLATQAAPDNGLHNTPSRGASMPVKIRPSRRFLRLVSCSGIWPLITLLWLSVGASPADWVHLASKVEKGLPVYSIRRSRLHSPARRRGDVVGLVRLQDNTKHRGGAVVIQQSAKRI